MQAENTEQKIQYILNEHGKLETIPQEDAVPIEHPVKYRLKNAFEVFVQVRRTENYWISNYGRCINNLNKKNFYEHKTGGHVHYTIFQVERRLLPVKTKRGRSAQKYETVIEKSKRETSPEELVAETFLVQYKGRKKIWHKNGDMDDNWYKNLIYVSEEEYKRLKFTEVSIEDLGLKQEYIEYQNKATNEVYAIYNSIRSRCKNTRSDKQDKNVAKCYEDAEMCQEWADNPKNFLRWYLEHYYAVGDESMAVDKDLLGNGSKIYSPDTCCILPQGLNTLLTNCKKRYKDGENKDNTLPLGVRYSGRTGRYFATITLWGGNQIVKLSEWDTLEEAFEEYKMMKEADNRTVIAKYKNSIPDNIYQALLQVEIRPY